MTSALAEIIKNLSLGRDKVDIIISDRGIFDALCWFEWLNKNPDKSNPYLDDQSFKTIKNFSLMTKWTTHLDLVYVFKVDPKESLKREYANLLTRKPGSIMNEPTIKSFNKSIDYSAKKYRKHFRLIESFDTTDYDPDTVSFRVTASILGILHDMLIEKIGYIDYGITIKLNDGINNFSQIKNCKIQYLNRDKVEHGEFLQPISIAVITNKERSKILVVKKSSARTSKDSPEMNKLLLYIGGHIRQEDDISNNNLSKILENTLHREIHEEIGESISVKNIEPFLIYSTKNPKSKKHLGVCYVITMDLENQSFKLTSDEFIMKTGKSKSGHILPIEEVISGKYSLEAWSQYILKNVFNKEVMTSYDLFDEDN
jgi:predicted NUDIX family phosphoesterase